MAASEVKILRCRPEASEHWPAALELWSSTRREALREQGVAVRVRESELLAQDELALALLRGEVIGLYAWQSMVPEDALAFPSHVRAALALAHSRILVAGHLCVSPNARGGVAGLRVADALVAASLERLAEGPETACLVRTRDNRHVDDLARRHGGVKLGETEAYGSRSSVFVFT